MTILMPFLHYYTCLGRLILLSAIGIIQTMRSLGKRMPLHFFSSDSELPWMERKRYRTNDIVNQKFFRVEKD